MIGVCVTEHMSCSTSSIIFQSPAGVGWNAHDLPGPPRPVHFVLVTSMVWIASIPGLARATEPDGSMMQVLVLQRFGFELHV